MLGGRLIAWQKGAGCGGTLLSKPSQIKLSYIKMRPMIIFEEPALNHGAEP
jgi:hypothetical protein